MKPFDSQGRKGRYKGQRLPRERIILTFEVDGDLLRGGDGNVVVRRLAGQEGSEVTPRDLGDGEGVLDRGGVGRLVGGVDELLVAPPGHLGKRIACGEETKIVTRPISWYGKFDFNLKEEEFSERSSGVFRYKKKS